MTEKPIYKQTQGLSFYLKSDKISHVNILVTVEEFDDGQLTISAKYGDEEVGKRMTSINNYKIVK